MKKRTTYL